MSTTHRILVSPGRRLSFASRGCVSIFATWHEGEGAAWFGGDLTGKVTGVLAWLHCPWASLGRRAGV